MPGQDNSAIRGEAQKDHAKDGVNEAKEGRADAVGMKRTTMTNVVNQVIRPAATIRIPQPGALGPGWYGPGEASWK